MNKTNGRSNKRPVQQQQARKARVTTVARSLRPQLDAAAAAYARLLADPCGAKMVSPVYSGGTGGYLLRVETDQIVNNGATDVGSMGYFCPGNISSSTQGAVGLSATFVTSDTAAQSINLNSALQPGLTFLAANAKSVRCVSACVQVSYPGTELNRSGVIAMGQGTYDSIAATPKSPSQLRTLAERVRRMPDGMVEMRLVPNISSQEYIDPSSTNVGQINPDMPLIFWSAFGIPVNTGIRVRLVAVYEWIPNAGVGLTNPSALETTNSANTLNHVLSTLKSYGDWAASGFTEAAHAASSLYGAAQTGKSLIRGSLRMGQLLLA